MTGVARAWLPDTAYTVSAVSGAFSDALASWSACWFSASRAAVVAVVDETSPPLQLTRIDDLAASAELQPAARRRLIESMLSVDLSEVELIENDRVAIDALVDRAVRDLLVRLGDADDRPGTAPIYRIILGIGDQECLSIFIRQDILASRLKQATKPVQQGRPPLIARSRALRKTAVAVEGLLGRGSLNLAELGSMAPGDILLLDQKNDDGVPLVLANSNTILARGTLTRHGDKPSLSF